MCFLVYRYGYVEFPSRKEAERALAQNRRLEVDRCRIDVQLFSKVPTLLQDEMRGDYHVAQFCFITLSCVFNIRM